MFDEKHPPAQITLCTSFAAVGASAMRKLARESIVLEASLCFRRGCDESPCCLRESVRARDVGVAAGSTVSKMKSAQRQLGRMVIKTRCLESSEVSPDPRADFEFAGIMTSTPTPSNHTPLPPQQQPQGEVGSDLGAEFGAAADLGEEDLHEHGGALRSISMHSFRP